MMLETLDQTRTTSTESDVTHWTCCNDDIALCGEDVSDQPVYDDDGPDPDCVVCNDLYTAPCCATCDFYPWGLYPSKFWSS